MGTVSAYVSGSVATTVNAANVRSGMERTDVGATATVVIARTSANRAPD